MRIACFFSPDELFVGDSLNGEPVVRREILPDGGASEVAFNGLVDLSYMDYDNEKQLIYVVGTDDGIFAEVIFIFPK